MALDRFTLPARLVARIGTMSLVLMCIHGPCYRVLIKLASLMLHRSTAGVRESFLLCCLVLIFTLLICSAFYQLIVRYVPWVIAAPFREPGKNGRH
jgi:fucose 4-O-acetylase-like acetyltransferase